MAINEDNVLQDSSKSPVFKVTNLDGIEQVNRTSDDLGGGEFVMSGGAYRLIPEMSEFVAV